MPVPFPPFLLLPLSIAPALFGFVLWRREPSPLSVRSSTARRPLWLVWGPPAALIVIVLVPLALAWLGGGEATAWMAYFVLLFGIRAVPVVVVISLVAGAVLLVRSLKMSTSGVGAALLIATGVYLTVCLLWWSAPPVEGRLSGSEGQPVAGVRVTRTVYRWRHLWFGGSSRITQGTPGLWATSTTRTGADGKFRLPGWVGPWSTTALGVSGILLDVDVPRDAGASLCVTHSGLAKPDRGFRPCGLQTTVRGSWIAMRTEWNPWRIRVTAELRDR